MRVIVPHNKDVETAKREVERSIEKLMNVNIPPLEITGLEKRWNDTTLSFSLIAGVGPLRSPIRGFAIVTDKHVTIDIDLPKLLTALVPEKTLESRVRGLLSG